MTDHETHPSADRPPPGSAGSITSTANHSAAYGFGTSRKPSQNGHSPAVNDFQAPEETDDDGSGLSANGTVRTFRPAVPETPPLPLTVPERSRWRPWRRTWTGKRHSWPQRIGGVLIAGSAIALAAWYIPRVVEGNKTLFSGSVASRGVITLNFSESGQLQKLNVYPGQRVRKGQVLATELGPNADSLVGADKAAIASDKAKIAQIQSAPTGAARQTSAVASADLSSAEAQLSRDQAHLAQDSFKVASTLIVAPSTGTVVAANGQPGEVVTPSGVRDYAANTQRSTATQKPTFSLLPYSPESGPPPAAGDSSVPVIALQTSTAWQVVGLVPEDAVSGVSSGRKVFVSIPSANITDAPGKIDQVLPAPIETSAGIEYQAVVSLSKPTSRQPLNGMAAFIRLAP